MSKFIRLTRTDGHKPVYIATASIRCITERFGESENAAVTFLNGDYERVTETPEQILDLIAGDESGLRERVVVLQTALDQAIEAGNLELVGEKVWGRATNGVPCVVATRFENPELAAYMVTKKEQRP